MRRHVCIALSSLVTLAALLWSEGPLAKAQNTSGKAAAEALFDRGLALLREGKYAEACERLEQSQSIERGIGTMLYLAECYDKLGKTASAWALFREASSLAQAQGQTERAEAGKRRADKLEKSLSRMTVVVPAESRVAGLKVSDNGSAVAEGAFGIALPVDPGPHRIEATAPGFRSWSKEVRIGDRAAHSEVRVPRLEEDPNAVVASAPPETTPERASQGAREPAAQSAAAKPEGMSTQRLVGLSIGGAGVLAIAAGAITGGLAIKNNNDAKKLTDDQGCTEAKCESLSNKAVHLANASTALWSVGGALVVGGLVTYLLGLKQDKERRRNVALGVDRQGATLRVGGVF